MYATGSRAARRATRASKGASAGGGRGSGRRATSAARPRPRRSARSSSASRRGDSPPPPPSRATAASSAAPTDDAPPPFASPTPVSRKPGARAAPASLVVIGPLRARRSPGAVDRALGAGLQRLALVVPGEGVDDRVDAPRHHGVELVEREADPVVGDARLGEVVRADLLAPVAAPDLPPAGR